MGEVYQKLALKILPQSRKVLRGAQKAWLTYRDKQCAFNALSHRSGTIYSMVVESCYAEMTVKQTAVLRAQLDCEEGDHSCGGQ